MNDVSYNSSKLSSSNPCMNPKIISLISEKLPPFHLGNPSIYRLERHNNHEKMRGMVEDMAP
jgi:hypothetical protein